MTASSKVLHVKVGETLQQAGKRAADAMRAAQAGRPVAPYFGIGFQEIGHLLGSLTPKRWELIAALREIGPVSVAELARYLGRNYKNVHADVQQPIERLAVERGGYGRVSVPWSKIAMDLKLPERTAA